MPFQVALLVGDEFEPGAERQAAQARVGRLLGRAARCRQWSLGVLALVAEAGARLEPGAEFGARGQRIVAAGRGQAPRDRLGLVLVVTHLQQGAAHFASQVRIGPAAAAAGDLGDALAQLLALAPGIGVLALAQQGQG